MTNLLHWRRVLGAPAAAFAVMLALSVAAIANAQTVKLQRSDSLIPAIPRADSDKAQAGSIADSLAAGQVVANEIGVRPPGLERDAKTVTSDLDKGIENNLDAALIQNGLHDDVKYEVRTGVVTLTGAVNSQAKRTQADRAAASVPNVKQVVNELEVKNQKATSR